MKHAALPIRRRISLKGGWEFNSGQIGKFRRRSARSDQHRHFAGFHGIEQMLQFLKRGAVAVQLREIVDDTAYLSFNPGSLRAASIWSMSPGNPLLQALAAIPVAPSVAAHSIIAVRGDGPIEIADDGVVSYQSAHIPEAVSELVVLASALVVEIRG